ncbi:DNA polymerase III subunit delta [Bacteroidia bacterium]|nr:DNA polymerase III subunit delta [Bacteroidia bacterium]
MLFADIIGQDALKGKLIQTVRENRVSHARLFLGAENAGSLPLAIAYAQYINCTDRSDTDSCGKCPSCNKYNKLIHPDLHFVFPVVKGKSGKAAISDMFIAEWRETLLSNPYVTYNQWLNTMDAENKQGGIFVDESKEILRKLSFKTYEADFKVMIIWMAEKMNLQTANKLLKILEEPPEKTLFLLIAESSDQILPTILSRTQLTRVPKIYKASLQSAEEESLYFDQFATMMRTCWKVWGNKQAMLDLIEWSNEMATLNREKQKAYLMYSLRMVRENIMLNRQQPQLAFLTDGESKFSANFNPFIHPGNVAQLSENLNKAHYHIEANGNAKIIFLDMACKIVVLLRH